MTHDDWGEANPLCFDSCVLVYVIAEWKKGHEDEP